jgi:dual specificity tyrosine-phosphorylation-regulated kinase 2/3/4
VVSCIDHLTGQKVAIKITRNTEIDHKFANSESKLLNFLMENDPENSYNIVRLIDEFSFRDHHCFVFELLHSDLFEYLKENGFIGFPTGKIREFAI